MMTIETVKKAEALIRERSRVTAAKWNALAPFKPAPIGVRYEMPTPEVADEELQWAIEEFRKRKLAAIDAQLRELGVDPVEQDSAA